MAKAIGSNAMKEMTNETNEEEAKKQRREANIES